MEDLGISIDVSIGRIDLLKRFYLATSLDNVATPSLLPEVLEILADYKGKREDMPAWCKATGKELIGMEEEGGQYRIYVRKCQNKGRHKIWQHIKIIVNSPCMIFLLWVM